VTVLSDIIDKLRDTTAQISKLDSAVAKFPQHDALQINMLSLQRRLRRLEEEFSEAAQHQQVDVCDYRMLSETSGVYPVAGVGSALTLFQEMVTTFFDSIKNGPKIRARISPEIAQRASMNLAYSYPGSLGFALAVESNRDLFGDSDLGLAIESAFKVMGARSTDEISELSKTVGVASIRKTYAWAKAHARFGLSADIKWIGGATPHVALLDSAGFERLSELIERTSEETVEQISLAGVLVGIDVKQGTFHFEPQEGDEIKGRLAETFSFHPSIPIPSRVIVNLHRHYRVYFSTEQEVVDWQLVSLLAGATDQH
jgi:hypothetical protein